MQRLCLRQSLRGCERHACCERPCSAPSMPVWRVQLAPLLALSGRRWHRPATAAPACHGRPAPRSTALLSAQERDKRWLMNNGKSGRCCRRQQRQHVIDALRPHQRHRFLRGSDLEIWTFVSVTAAPACHQRPSARSAAPLSAWHAVSGKGPSAICGEPEFKQQQREHAITALLPDQQHEKSEPSARQDRQQRVH